MEGTWQRISPIFVLSTLFVFAYVDMLDEAIFAIAVGSFILLPLSFFLRQRNIKNNGEYTNATVIETRRVQRRGNVIYFPVVKYDVNGHVYETKSNVSHMRPRYKDGETVKIVYSKKDAEKIIILNDPPTAAIFMGIFLLIGTIMLGAVLYGQLS